MTKVDFLLSIIHFSSFPVLESYMKDNYGKPQKFLLLALEDKYPEAAQEHLENLKEQYRHNARAKNAQNLHISAFELYKIDKPYFKEMQKKIDKLQNDEDCIDRHNYNNGADTDHGAEKIDYNMARYGEYYNSDQPMDIENDEDI